MHFVGAASIPLKSAWRVSNRPGTRFNLGSIKKLFTRVAFGQMVEQGKLALDDKIE
jgi:CubicO group peptidase (beta-lactamase class C family)